MKIGIDARLYGPMHTGLGRYVESLLNEIFILDKKNTYVLFVSPENANTYQQSDRLKVVITDIKIYTFAEQLLLPILFLKENLDLLHVPYFNAPLLYPKKIAVTIHDLIKHFSKGQEATTHKWWMYTLRRIGYHIETFIISWRASLIIVPTNFVKRQLMDVLKIPERKIHLTYESVSDTFRVLNQTKKQQEETLKFYKLSSPFVIYTGNLYPHKNVDRLLDAIIAINTTHKRKLNLAIVCARSVFWQRMEKKIKDKGASSYIKLLGYVDDEGLSKLYPLAKALVHPSKMEGFGLTGLEAMKLGLPVISSTSDPLPEVYEDSCLYFNPDSTTDLVSKINLLLDSPKLANSLSKKGYLQVKKYSWKRAAVQTLKLYDIYGKK